MPEPFEPRASARLEPSGADDCVRLPSGRTLDLRRSRWHGPLDAEELDYCRRHAIPIAYDCVQIGWVPVSCIDDAPPAGSGERAIELQELVTAEQDMRRLLATLTARSDPAALAPLVAAFRSRRGLVAANQCHLALLAELAHTAPPAVVSSDHDAAAEFSFRPWTAADAPRYRAMLDNPRLWEYLPESYPQQLTEETAMALIELGRADPRQEVLAVVRDGEPVGQCLLRFHEPFAGKRSAEVAYWLAEEHWSKGWMRRILPAFVARSFEAHDLDVIEAWIRDDHAASERVAERSGFCRDSFAFEAELAAALGKPRARRWIALRPAPGRAGAAVAPRDSRASVKER